MSRYRLAEDIGVLDDGVRVFAAALPDGPIVVLAGIAADIWRVLPGSAEADAAARLIADGLSPAEEAAGDVSMYAQAFVDAGLLVPQNEEQP